MSQVSPPKRDRYRYGWRFVEVTRRDGRKDLKQVPLTLEDVLHPEVGDFIVTSTAHHDDLRYLFNGFRARRKVWPPGMVVLSDCRVAWGVEAPRPHGPDVIVLSNVTDPDRDWSTFDVAKEGARPLLVIEVTSPETRRNDIKIKVEHYHRVGVRQYVIVDAKEKGDTRTLKLIGYRHTPEKYVPMAPDDLGRLKLIGLGLLLGVRGPRVVLYDEQTGEEIGDYEAVVEELAAERAARQEAQEARQATEEAMNEVVEERNAARRAQRKEAQARREEAKARQKLEKKLARLQARLAALEPDASAEE